MLMEVQSFQRIPDQLIERSWHTIFCRRGKRLSQKVHGAIRDLLCDYCHTVLRKNGKHDLDGVPGEFQSYGQVPTIHAYR